MVVFMSATGVAKIRTTLVIEADLFEKLRQSFGKNMSAAVNALLRKELFGKKKSMFGAFRGKVSAKDRIEDGDIHADLYR